MVSKRDFLLLLDGVVELVHVELGVLVRGAGVSVRGGLGFAVSGLFLSGHPPAVPE